jgi:hypothetical protein
MPSQIVRGATLPASGSIVIQTNDYATLQVFAPTAGDGPNMLTAVENLDGTVGPALLSWKANATGIGTPANDPTGAVFDQLPTTYDVSGLFNVVIENQTAAAITFDYGLSDSKLNIPSSGGSIPNPLPVTFAQPIQVEGTNDDGQALAVGGRNFVSGNFQVENNYNGNQMPVSVVFQAPTGFPLTIPGGGGNFNWGETSIADDYQNEPYGVLDVTLAAGATLLVQVQTMLGTLRNTIVTDQLGTPVASALINATGTYYFNKAAMAGVSLTNNGTGDVTLNFAGESTGTPPFKFF